MVLHPLPDLPQQKSQVLVVAVLSGEAECMCVIQCIFKDLSVDWL